jgi:hypothetical protein
VKKPTKRASYAKLTPLDKLLDKAFVKKGTCSREEFSLR